MILGITAQNHDASLALIDGNKIVWAAHAERYSRVKNDNLLNADMLADMRNYGEPTELVWFEKPLQKDLRRLLSGQRPWRVVPNDQLRAVGLNHLPINYVGHHHSHAASAYYSSPFKEATVVCIDSIGEFETLTVWQGEGNDLKKVYTQGYPDSVGLWFSSMTQRIGLKPNEEEYILMGMAAYGDPNKYKAAIYEDFFSVINGPEIKFKRNLHRGCPDWRLDLLKEQDTFDIAAATQQVYTELLQGISRWARANLPSKNIVLMGGCALNCVANSEITGDWDKVWIMPNPGDAGSSVGAVAAFFGEQVTWPGAYLGTNMGKEYPVDETISILRKDKIVGVATGRAEFGPRALGHRSLLADPRGPEIKDTVNAIKRRQQFRPFAPAILEEHVHDYFDMPQGITASPFMQFVAKCTKPDEFPAIIHKDGTSRVQTVSKNDSPGFRKLLEDWYALTGCPMLLNTSLNIKGMPMVNNIEHAQDFYLKYNVPVVT